MSILAFKDFLKEVAANAVGGGGVEGIGYPPKSAKGEPGIHVRKKKKTPMFRRPLAMKEEILYEDWGELEEAAQYQGRTVQLNKPVRSGDGKHKFYVFVRNDKGNIVKVGFGDPNMEIKRDSLNRRKAYRSRHNCAVPGPKWKANYWSCKMWSDRSVSSIVKEAELKHTHAFGQTVDNCPRCQQVSRNAPSRSMAQKNADSLKKKLDDTDLRRRRAQIAARHALGETMTIDEAPTTKHSHPVVFGRRVEGCPRCDELNKGASTVKWRKSQATRDAERTEDIRKHFDSEKHKSGKCGPVCTYGEW